MNPFKNGSFGRPSRRTCRTRAADECPSRGRWLSCDPTVRGRPFQCFIHWGVFFSRFRRMFLLGSYGKNELAQDEGFSKNLDCTVDRGAQHKVYERIRTSVRLSGGRWHTCTGHDSFPSVVSEQALCGARADGAAGRCASSHPYRIDHGTWLA